ncbi:MAG: efflux RND transporter periplasmic adaptor subunit [Synergistaceae bacterium]|nr:efflux RND transporter periplasmic adaptor subunit [Synergistaceae bacterium]
MREKKEQRPEGKLGPKIIYCASVAAIVVLWAVAFRSYFEQYDSAHPEVAWALPWVQVDTIMASGVYLWNETEVKAPASGTVSFPSGTGPLRVAKGALLARVGGKDVRAGQEGYFLAGSDGMEGKWRYPTLWPGHDELPSAAAVTMTKEGQNVKDGTVIGKIVLQPQDLRFIGYADLTGNLEEDLASNRVMVKMDVLDTPSHAPVRVYERVGHRAKMYLTVPWFPPDVALSRNCEMIIEAGTSTGVTVPESSVILKGGVRGAFVLKGSEAAFAKVEGRSIGGNRFLVTSGVKLGDAVIVNASSAREGRVRLW